MTGEEEDTDVGFPGPGHYIAEREWPMKIAMSVLAFGAVIGGVLQIPGVDRGVERFLDPTFADSHLYGLTGSTGSDWVGLIIGAVIAIVGDHDRLRDLGPLAADGAETPGALRRDLHPARPQVVLR